MGHEIELLSFSTKPSLFLVTHLLFPLQMVLQLPAAAAVHVVRHQIVCGPKVARRAHSTQVRRARRVNARVIGHLKQQQQPQAQKDKEEEEAQSELKEGNQIKRVV